MRKKRDAKNKKPLGEETEEDGESSSEGVVVEADC
jgi:hypothetical protein